MKNRGKINAYKRKRYHTDPTYRLKKLIRKAVRRLHSKSKKTSILLGCTWEYFNQWIKSQMSDTMTFDTIHIDHMIPLASFDLTKPEEQRKVSHYTNLQPLTPYENMSKGNRIVYDMRWNGQQWEIKHDGVYVPRD